MRTSENNLKIEPKRDLQIETPMGHTVTILETDNFNSHQTNLAFVKFKNGDQFSGHLTNGLCDGKGKYYFVRKSKDEENEKSENEKSEKDNLNLCLASPLEESEIGKFEISKDFKNWKQFFGEFYEGSFKSGQKHGKGNYFYEDGTVYQGQWKEGLKEGAGELTFPNGSRYKGCFQDGICNGDGTFWFGTGDWIQGNWLDNSAHGLCEIGFLKEDLKVLANLDEGVVSSDQTVRIEFKTGHTYEGLIEEGKAQGRGKFQDQLKQIELEGDWQNGVPHGQGIMTLGLTVKVEGFWENGKLERRASIRHPSFTIRCAFLNGHPHPDQQGELELKDKFKYCGAFNPDFSFSGPGTVTTEKFIFWGHWKTQRKYLNDTLNNNSFKTDKNDFKIMFKSGHSIEGKMENGKILHQSCSIRFLNGDCYQGHVDAKFQPSGQGKYCFTSGNQYAGEFAGGQITGKGKMTFGNGDVYVGSFDRGQMHGEGQYSNKENSVDGVFENGRLAEITRRA